MLEDGYSGGWIVPDSETKVATWFVAPCFSSYWARPAVREA